MKKLIVLMCIMVLALTALAIPAGAASPEDLTALADIAPVDAPFFAAIRTDAGYIEELDALIAKAGESIPDLAGFSLSDQIEIAILSSPEFEGGFDENIAPWLGDTAAVFVLNSEVLMHGMDGRGMTGGTVIALSITDAEAAEAFLDTAFADDLASEDGFKEITDGGVIYRDRPSEGGILVTESVLLVAGADADFDAVILPGEDAQSLADTADFQDTLALLPGDDYNIIAYADMRDVMEVMMVEMQREFGPMAEELGIDLSMMADLGSTQAFGFTILNGRTLTIDGATYAPNTPEEFAAHISQPINPDFLANVPDTAFLLIAGEGIGRNLGALTEAFYMLSDLLVEQGLTPGAMDPSLPSFAADRQLRDIATFARFAFRATFGVEVQDVLAWIDSDFTTFATLTNEGPFDVQSGMGLVFATDEPDATAEFVDGLAANVQRVFTQATFEDGIVTLPEDGQVFPGLPAMLAGSNDSVFAMGTDSAVSLALGLESDAAPLTDSDIYAYESGLFLENTNGLLFINMEPVRATVAGLLVAYAEEIEEMGTSPEELEMLKNMLGLLDSSIISTANSEDGTVGTVRATLTLNE